MLDHSDPRRIVQHELQSLGRESRLFNKLAPARALRLIRASAERSFPAESLILDEGAEIEEVYIICRGMVSIGLYRNTDPTVWLYVSGPGTVVDTCVLLDPPISPVSVRALSDLEVLAIPRAEFLQVIEEEPSVGYDIIRSLCNRLCLINRVLVEEFCQAPQGPSRN